MYALYAKIFSSTKKKKKKNHYAVLTKCLIDITVAVKLKTNDYCLFVFCTNC